MPKQSSALDISYVSGIISNDDTLYIDNKNNMSMNNIKDQWGVDGYYVPTNDWHWHKPKTFWAKGKKENIIEYEAKR